MQAPGIGDDFFCLRLGSVALPISLLVNRSCFLFGSLNHLSGRLIRVRSNERRFFTIRCRLVLDTSRFGLQIIDLGLNISKRRAGTLLGCHDVAHPAFKFCRVFIELRLALIGNGSRRSPGFLDLFVSEFFVLGGLIRHEPGRSLGIRSDQCSLAHRCSQLLLSFIPQKGGIPVCSFADLSPPLVDPGKDRLHSLLGIGDEFPCLSLCSGDLPGSFKSILIGLVSCAGRCVSDCASTGLGSIGDRLRSFARRRFDARCPIDSTGRVVVEGGDAIR